MSSSNIIDLVSESSTQGTSQGTTSEGIFLNAPVGQEHEAAIEKHRELLLKFQTYYTPKLYLILEKYIMWKTGLQ
jgi:hypothetical protein